MHGVAILGIKEIRCYVEVFAYLDHSHAVKAIISALVTALAG